MTRATRPTPPVVACDWVLSMVAVISSLAPRRDERIRAADDLTDFLGDFGLPGRVGQAGVRPDQFLGVVGRRLARTPAAFGSNSYCGNIPPTGSSVVSSTSSGRIRRASGVWVSIDTNFV